MALGIHFFNYLKIRDWLFFILVVISISLPHTARATTPTLLVLGDSLSAEYGITRGTGWVALLEKKLTQEKIAMQVVNASISGETSSGGLARLNTLLTKHQPKIVVVELGGNDALRGMSMTQTQKNLSQIVNLSKKAGAKVLLLGVQVPPNMGASYAGEFIKVYSQTAQLHRIAFVATFLSGVADRTDPREWFQRDGIHPLEIAHPTLLANVWPALKKILP